jgi:anti-anti-sigma factor
MKIRHEGENLNVSELEELGLANSGHFRSQICAALPAGVKNIIIDLSRTDFMDCGGLGALVALNKTARTHNDGVAVHLVNPVPQVRQIFELTRMGQIFGMRHA